jgi:hypothetical protein
LASSGSRYVLNIIVYLGTPTEDERQQVASEWADDNERRTVGEEAVLIAVRGMENRGHVIVIDNSFSSPQLCMSLMACGIWTTGIVRKSPRGFPASLACFLATNLHPRGTIAVKMHKSHKVVAIYWVDRKHVFLISIATNLLAAGRCVAGRWVNWDCMEFPTLPILL